ncbi:MAG TPA: ABC transporter permease [Bryobacteraceae bacterium]|jgi:spermidine/putrescine transport system permease protein|nr:ABC transporter permease [Bryobacteraceae bacterium]
MSRLRVAFLSPAAIVTIALFAIPIGIICAYSLLSRGAYGGVILPWTIESYRRVFDPLYAEILWRSFVLAAISTSLCLILGFPLALYIARSKRRTLLLNLVMLPFWTSFLIRTYAWMFLLRDTGLINTILQSLHLIRQPLPLLFNDGAVVLGLVYGYLPFMVLPLYATLEKLDPALLDAARDLGATPWVATWKIIVPLSRSGMLAGSLLVFIPCLGAYLTPDLLGGGKTVMIGNLVQNQFTTARDWPFGSAVSLLLMALVLIILLRMLSRQSEQLL